MIGSCGKRKLAGSGRVAFEVSSTGSTRTGNGIEKPLVGAFADRDWNCLISLAREHGFDPDHAYDEALQPDEDEAGELGLAATQELAVALSEALRKDTASLEEGDPEEETIQLGWVYSPDHGWELASMIRVGPPDRPDLQVGWVHVRQLGELVESGPVQISRAPEPQ